MTRITIPDGDIYPVDLVRRAVEKLEAETYASASHGAWAQARGRARMVGALTALTDTTPAEAARALRFPDAHSGHNAQRAWERGSPETRTAYLRRVLAIVDEVAT